MCNTLDVNIQEITNNININVTENNCTTNLVIENDCSSVNINVAEYLIVDNLHEEHIRFSDLPELPCE